MHDYHHKQWNCVSYAPSCIKNDLLGVPVTPEKKHLTLDLQKSDVRKKYSYKSNPYAGAQAASIAKRNARERNRVKQVNDGFNALRKRLPAAVVSALSGGARRGSGKKLSKVDTLRMVVEYIRYLEGLINVSDPMDITRRTTRADMETCLSYDVNESIFRGRSSPYSESVPSPADSECSSGVSSVNSSCNNYFSNKQQTLDQWSPMGDEDLLDAISLWQQK